MSREEISQLTKRGKFWGKGGALALEREELDDDIRGGHIAGYTHPSVAALSAASSTHYAASGNAWSRARTGRIWWLLPAIWCALKADRLSDEMVRLNGGTLDGLSIGNLVIRMSVKRKRGDHQEAQRCYQKALDHPERTRNDYALLLMDKAENATDKVTALAAYEEAVLLPVPNQTTVRVRRSYARYMLSIGKPDVAQIILVGAEAITIVDPNLADQRQKIAGERVAIQNALSRQRWSSK